MWTWRKWLWTWKARRGRGSGGLCRFSGRGLGRVGCAHHGRPGMPGVRPGGPDRARTGAHGRARRPSPPTPTRRSAWLAGRPAGRAAVVDVGTADFVVFCESRSPWTWERWTLPFSRTQRGSGGLGRFARTSPPSRERPGPTRGEYALPVVRRGCGNEGLCRFDSPAPPLTTDGRASAVEPGALPACPRTPLCLAGWLAGWLASRAAVGNADFVVFASSVRRGRGSGGLCRFGESGHRRRPRADQGPFPGYPRHAGLPGWLAGRPCGRRGRGNRGLSRFCEFGSPWTWERGTLSFRRVRASPPTTG